MATGDLVDLRYPEAGRHLRKYCREGASQPGPQQSSLRLRPDDTCHAAVRLDARGRHGAVPRTSGRQHRTRPRDHPHQRQRTVPGETLYDTCTVL